MTYLLRVRSPPGAVIALRRKGLLAAPVPASERPRPRRAAPAALWRWLAWAASLVLACGCGGTILWMGLTAYADCPRSHQERLLGSAAVALAVTMGVLEPLAVCVSRGFSRRLV